MTEEKPEQRRSQGQKDRSRGVSHGTSILLLFLGLLVVGTAGYFMNRGLLVGYISAHIAALGVIGLLGIAAGHLARRKGYHYWKAFLFALSLPILLGLLAVFAFYFLKGSINCGGSVSLAVALVILLGCFLAKRKPQDSRSMLTGHRE